MVVKKPVKVQTAKFEHHGEGGCQIVNGNQHSIVVNISIRQTKTLGRSSKITTAFQWMI